MDGIDQWVKRNYIILGILILGSLLFFYNLGKESFWQDEASSVFFVYDFVEMVKVLFSLEINMWLYHFLLYFWFKLGTSEFFVRSLSVFFSLIATVGMYRLGIEIKDKTLGYYAAFLFVINTFVIEISQEARSYSLFICLLIYSSIYFLKSIKTPNRKQWLTYALITILSIYSHIYTVILIGIQVITLYFLRKDKKIRKHSLEAFLLLFFSSLPLIILSHKHVENLTWIQKPTFHDLASVVRHLSSNSWMLTIFFLCIIIFGGAYHVRRKFIFTIKYIYLLLWVFLPITSIFLFSILIKPMFVDRYFSVTLPGYMLLLSHELLRFKNKRISLMMLALIAIISVPTLKNYYQTQRKDDWRQAIHFVTEQAQSTDTIFVYPTFTERPVWYYTYQNELFQKKSPRVVYLTYPIKGNDDHLFTQENLQLIDTTARQSKKIWLISSHDMVLYERIHQREEIQRIFSKYLSLKKKNSFNGSLKVYVYEKKNIRETDRSSQ